MSRRKEKTEPQFSDLERMEMFVKRTQDLVNEPIWKSGGLSIKVNMLPTGTTIEEPDSGQLKSYLLTFRPFVLQNDTIYFHDIRGVAHRYLRKELTKEAEHLQGYKQMWRDAMQKGRIMVSADGETLSPEAVLDAHLYGYFFHYQHANVEALKKFEALPVRVDKVRLYDTLADLTEVIIQLGNFIGYGLKNDYFDIS